MVMGLVVGALALGATAGVASAAPPSVDFDVSPPTARVGATVGFHGSAHGADGAGIASVGWDFGDGTGTGGDLTVAHAYTSTGTRTVTLTATDVNGESASASRTVRVVGNPVAAFSFAPTVPNVDGSVAFDGRASDDPGGAIASYSWSFGDGTTAGGAQPSHAYATSGDKAVTLTVTAALDGRTDSVTRTVHVNVPPRASFVFAGVSAPSGQDPFTPVLGQQVAFSAQGSSDGDGRVVSWAWDLGAGTFGAPATVPWLLTTFAVAGPRTVRVRVTDDGGATATAQAAFRVNTRPVAGFDVAPSAPSTGATVALTSTASDADGAADLASTSWDLNGDGVFGDATGSTAQAVFLTAGTYRVGERVADKGGAAAVATRDVVVTGPPASGPSDPSVPVVSSPGGAVTVPFASGGGGSSPAGRGPAAGAGATGTKAKPAIVVRALRGVRVQLAGSVTGTRTKITKLVVLGPVGALVVVRCHGSGCPRKAVRRHFTAAGKLRLKALQRTFGAGAEVVVSVAKAGYATRRTTLTMRRGKAPRRVEACVVPVPGGAPKAGACPS
jgi:PKD repeat protein